MFKAVVGKRSIIKEPQTDALLSGSAVYAASNVFNAAIPFFLLPVLTRLLSPAEYGLAGMFLLMLALLGAFTGLSMHGTANRKYFDGDTGADLAIYIAHCALIIALASILVFWQYTCVVALYRNGLG